MSSRALVIAGFLVQRAGQVIQWNPRRV